VVLYRLNHTAATFANNSLSAANLGPAVGDELTSDARAAANAGLVGVWLKRPYVHAAQAQRVAALEPNEDLTGIHRIETLNQVPELLNRLAGEK